MKHVTAVLLLSLCAGPRVDIEPGEWMSVSPAPPVSPASVRPQSGGNRIGTDCCAAITTTAVPVRLPPLSHRQPDYQPEIKQGENQSQTRQMTLSTGMNEEEFDHNGQLSTAIIKRFVDVY